MPEGKYQRRVFAACASVTVGLATLFVLAGLGALASGGAQTAPSEDPLPIARMVVRPDQIAQELARAKQGALIKLPRADFEARVRQAAQSVAAPKAVARMIRAQYFAELNDQDLTLGHGEWVVQNATKSGALLPLAPLSLALSNCAWDDGRDAVIGDIDGKGLAAWMEESGTASLLFDWSCRGTPTPQGLRFDLRLPSCPQTTLELKLPADAWPALPAKAGMLTGPHDAGTAGKRLWKLQFAGKAQTELVIRKMQGGPASTFCQAQVRQVIAPDRLTAEYEFQVEIPHGAVRTLTFDGDPGLEPFEVSAASADLQWRWEAAGPATKGGTGALTVEFRVPQQGNITGLRVRCLAPRPSLETDWVSPSLRLRQGTCRAETLHLLIHPDMQLERWNGGDFQLVGGTTDVDGGFALSLVDMRAAAGGPTARPRCRLVAGAVEFATSQISRWQIGAATATLDSELSFEVSRGQLHQLAVTLPAVAGPYQIASVDMEPKELLRDWSVAGKLLLVDLQRGITPRINARLKVHCRATHAAGSRSVILDVPDVAAMGASLRQSRFAIVVEPGLDAQLLQSSAPPEATSPGQAVTAGAEAVAYAFGYRDQPLSGKLQLFPQRPQLRARVREEFSLVRGAGRWQAQVEIEPLLGRPNFLDVRLAALLPRGWQIHADAELGLVHHWERLPLQESLPRLLTLGADGVVGQAALAASVPRGTVWRVHLTKPLARKTSLSFDGALAPAENMTTAQTPLVALLGAVEQRNETVAIANGGEVVADAVCESAELTTSLAADGGTYHMLRMRLRNWRQPRFEVIVPGSTKGLSARVDGSWVDRVETSTAPGETRLSVPAHAGATTQLIEIGYASTATAADGWLLPALHAPMPQLGGSLRPMSQARFWRLPPGWVPWEQSRLRRRGEPASLRPDQRPAALAARAWHADEMLLPRGERLSPAWQELPRGDLAKAEAAVRSQLGEKAKLGEVLQRLSAEISLAVDMEALRSAERSPVTTVVIPAAGRPLLENIGLVLLPCHVRVLVTTRERLEAWHEQLANASGIVEGIEPAVADAALFGMDHGGCFTSVADWLRVSAAADSTPTEHSPLNLFATSPDAGWIEWEPIPGLGPDESLLLFHEGTGRALGFMLSAMWLVVTIWSCRRLSTAMFFRAHLLATGTLALAVLWLPGPARELLAWPVLLIELLAFAVTITVRAWPGRAPLPSKSTLIRPANVALLVFGAIAAVPLAAQVPAGDAHVVFLVGTGEPDKEFALVAPETLKKLDDLINRPTTPTNGVVVSARYQVSVHEGLVDVQASFDIYQFLDKNTVVLPLTGVRLKPGVFLDGAPVFPVAHKAGYALPVHGKGFHRLTLTFESRAGLTSDFQQVRFDVPKAGQCQLEMRWGAPLRDVQALGGLGDTTVQVDKKGNATLHSQFGHEAVMQLRWPATQATAAAKNVEIREAYFWDLRPSTLGLTGAVQLGVPKGTLSQMRFTLPDEIDVRSVELAGRAGAPSALPNHAIRQWEVVGKGIGRQLVVSFAGPVSGQVSLVIEMLPRIALSPGQWLLRLPTPLQGTVTDSFLAYRVDGVEAAPNPLNLSVRSLPAKQFAEEWTKLAQRDAPVVSIAQSIRRVAPSAALALAVEPARPSAQLDLRWQVGARHAELTGRIALAGATENQLLIELELPPAFKLIDIDGEYVHHFSRQDRLVQVWLRQPRKQVDLQLRGWVNHPAGAARFDLAPVRCAQARTAATSITVEPEPGLALKLDRMQQLTRTGTEGTWQFTASNFTYAASFALQAAPMPATARAFTLVEQRGTGAVMTTALHIQPRPGDVQITVADWQGEDLRLDVPAPVQYKSHRQQGTRHIWSLHFPNGLPQTVPLTLHGRIVPESSGAPMTLPLVHLDGAQLRDYWLALVGVDLAGKDGPAMRELSAFDTAVPPYPPPPHALADSTKIGQLGDMQSSVVVRGLPASTAVRTLQAQQEAYWAGTGWAHQLRLMAFTNGQGELRIRLPENAIARALAVGGQVIVPHDASLVVPLSGPPGPRFLQVCWSYPAELESPHAPILDRATVDGLDPAALPVRFWLPQAYRHPPTPAGRGEPAAEALLHDAEARMRLCTLWADAGAPREDLHRQQDALQAELRWAEASLVGFEGHSDLKRRVKQQADKNRRLAKQDGYEHTAVYDAPPSDAWPFMAGMNGLPIIWGINASPPPGPLPLDSYAELEGVFTRTATEFLLLVIVALLLLSYLRGGYAVLNALWPESLAGLALVGISFAGLSPIGVLLLGIAVVMRLLWLARLAQRVLRSWFTRAAEPSHHTPVPAPPAPEE